MTHEKATLTENQIISIKKTKTCGVLITKANQLNHYQ